MKLMPDEVLELSAQTGVSEKDIEMVADVVGANWASILMQAMRLKNERDAEARKAVK